MQAEEIIRVRNRYYIIASSPAAAIRTFALKDGDTFGVFDRYGDILPLGKGEQGLYNGCTRYLSLFELRIGDTRPLILSSMVKSDNSLLTVDLTNPDIRQDGRLFLPRETVHLYRSRFLWRDTCYELLRLDNFTPAPIEISLRYLFEADYADIFEIRGMGRLRRGEMEPPSVMEDRVRFSYVGTDGTRRATQIVFSPAPDALGEREAEFRVRIEPRKVVSLFVTVSLLASGEDAVAVETFERRYRDYDAHRATRAGGARIHTSNERFNSWIDRSASDLDMMVTETSHGLYPYGGIPWYCSPFGRDGIITAYEYLWVDPAVTRGVLAFLAANQAGDADDAKDAEPGKMFHEFRTGEMAATGEIPFGRYYGSIDSTPLFLFLAGAYYDRTGDLPFIRSIWPHVVRGIEWMDRHGDRDGDGFLEYMRHTEKGLAAQGWKDSWDAVFYADGSLVNGPVALVEVQAYAYAARKAAARLARALGYRILSDTFEASAAELRRAFEERFWDEEKQTYILALDGDKKPCRVRSSNAGQALFTGIVDPDRARKVVAEMMRDEFFTGWGIRTIATGEARYNPMSYHNGSVWPHDNALIGYGMARYGMSEPFMKLFTAMFDVSNCMEGHRLPELFCGFRRRKGESLIQYPVACAPQSWASAAVFLFLQGCLGLSFDSEKNTIIFDKPLLPPFLKWMEIRDLVFRDTTLDLLVAYYEHDVILRVLRKEGTATIVKTL